MTFYRKFIDKVDLSICLLELSNLEAKEAALKILSEEVPFGEKFKAILQLNSQFSEKIGLRFLEDLTLCNDSKLTNGIQNISKKMRQLNLKFIEMGKSEGFLNPRFNSEFILFLAEKFSLLFKDPELSKFYPEFSERTKIATEVFYFGVTMKKRQ